MNYTIFMWLYGAAHGSPVLSPLTVFFAVYFPYIVMILAGLFLLFHHEVFPAENPYKVFKEKKKEISIVFVAGIVAWSVAYILKHLIHAARPFVNFPSQVQALIVENGYSFPSGHATFFGALAMAIYLLHRRAGYFFFVCALIIGIARIAAGVHYPVDILAGYALGILVAYLFKNV